jgi:hypothetical protein
MPDRVRVTPNQLDLVFSLDGASPVVWRACHPSCSASGPASTSVGFTGEGSAAGAPRLRVPGRESTSSGCASPPSSPRIRARAPRSSGRLACRRRPPRQGVRRLKERLRGGAHGAPGGGECRRVHGGAPARSGARAGRGLFHPRPGLRPYSIACTGCSWARTVCAPSTTRAERLLRSGWGNGAEFAAASGPSSSRPTAPARFSRDLVKASPSPPRPSRGA